MEAANVSCWVVIQQVGSAIRGWASSAEKPLRPWTPKSDADFAVFCDDSKLPTLATNLRMPSVFKSNGPFGFYEHTKLGSELAKVSQKWNLIIYGSDTLEEGINFKLNVNTPTLYRCEDAIWIMRYGFHDAVDVVRRRPRFEGFATYKKAGKIAKEATTVTIGDIKGPPFPPCRRGKVACDKAWSQFDQDVVALSNRVEDEMQQGFDGLIKENWFHHCLYCGQFCDTHGQLRRHHSVCHKGFLMPKVRDPSTWPELSMDYFADLHMQYCGYQQRVRDRLQDFDIKDIEAGKVCTLIDPCVGCQEYMRNNHDPYEPCILLDDVAQDCIACYTVDEYLKHDGWYMQPEAKRTHEEVVKAQRALHSSKESGKTFEQALKAYTGLLAPVIIDVDNLPPDVDLGDHSDSDYSDSCYSDASGVYDPLQQARYSGGIHEEDEIDPREVLVAESLKRYDNYKFDISSTGSDSDYSDSDEPNVFYLHCLPPDPTPLFHSSASS